MGKRIAVIIISVLALALGASSSASALDGERDGETIKRPDLIWQGLCVGASLDLSAASQIRCAHGTQKPADSQPDKVGTHSQDLRPRDAADAPSPDDALGSKPHPPREHDGFSGYMRAKERGDYHKPQRTDLGESRMTDDGQIGQTIEKTEGYAALGDSVAAGLGLAGRVDGDTRCGRSTGAYAYEVADARDLEVNHLACDGATLGDLFTEQEISGPNITRQLDGAFQNGTPALITITAGANDVRWTDFLLKCYGGTCGTTVDEFTAGGLLLALEIKLHTAMRQIEQRSSGQPPEVIMTGYYNPLSDDCAEAEPRFTEDELDWLDEQTGRLNQTLRSAAAQYDFAVFEPVDFYGHGICSDDPWVQTLDDPAPFHPTAKGQQVIARSIIL